MVFGSDRKGDEGVYGMGLKITNSCPESVIKKRDQNRDRIKEYILQDDILFNSPSGAACFVVGGSTNGNTEWKTADGATLKELEK